MNTNYALFRLFGIAVYFVTNTVAREGIIDGDKAIDNQFPYQVTLLIEHMIICGGGIIGNQFILSAAHCVLKDNGMFNDEPMTILAGTNDVLNKDKSGMIVKVKKIYVPMEYAAHQIISLGDIAVLKLKFSLELRKHKNLKALNLPINQNETYAGKLAMIAGFGWQWIKIDKNGSTGGNNDTDLQFAEVDVLDHCIKSKIRVEKQFCARVKQRDSSKSRGVCFFDSGSPLVYNGIVIGILSASPKGCSEKYDGALYTRVSRYIDLIAYAIHDKRSPHVRTHVTTS